MNCRLPILLFFAVCTVLYACKDKDYPQPIPLTTNLDVINATADTLNYFINGTRQNNLSSLYSGGATYYPVGGVIAGAQNYSFKKAGSPNVLFSTSYTLDTGQYYSIFIGGETVAKTFLVNDNFTQAALVAATDTSKTMGVIRFVHAAPDMGALSVVINKVAPTGFTNLSFKSVSPYALVSDTLNEVKVYQSGGLTPIVDTTFTFQSRIIYTLFAKGVLNGNGNAAFSVVLLNIGTIPTSN